MTPLHTFWISGRLPPAGPDEQHRHQQQKSNGIFKRAGIEM
ncbi:MAG: hypothetical protein R2911_42410 [Caldilineaceae bacterium]